MRSAGVIARIQWRGEALLSRYEIRLNGSHGQARAAKASPVKRRGAGKTIDFFLTNRRERVTVFQNLVAKPGSRVSRAPLGLSALAREERGQAIENKQFREMLRFRASRTYGPLANASLCEMNPFVFADFPPRGGPKRNDREADGGFGARAAEAARSATPAIQNGAASPCISVRGSSLMFGRARFVLVEL
jgi:hypothetical protein